MARKFHLDFIKKHYSESTIIFIKTIAHRIYRYNKNALIITCGASGTGKSYVDLELMRGIYAYVHGEFPSDEEVVNRTFFKLNEFLKILNSDDIKDSKKSRGQMFISEEVGTQASNRTHLNVANRAYSFIVQTFRAKGMVLFFNVPSFTFVDSQVRKQLHYLLETKMIDSKNKTCIVKPLELQYNSRMDQIYYHNLVAETADHEYVELDLIDIPKIPNSLAELYEQKKSDFINNLNKDLQNSLQRYEDKENKEREMVSPIEGKKPLTERQLQIYELTKEGKTQSEIAKLFSINQSCVFHTLNSIKKKGYDITKGGEMSEKEVDGLVIKHYIDKQPNRNLNSVTAQ